jgi:hypothetical protein
MPACIATYILYWWIRVLQCFWFNFLPVKQCTEFQHDRHTVEEWLEGTGFASCNIFWKPVAFLVLL